MFISIKVFDFDFSTLQAHHGLHPVTTSTHNPPPRSPIEHTPLICNYYWYMRISDYTLRATAFPREFFEKIGTRTKKNTALVPRPPSPPPLAKTRGN